MRGFSQNEDQFRAGRGSGATPASWYPRGALDALSSELARGLHGGNRHGRASTLIQEVTASNPTIMSSGAWGDQADGGEGVEGGDAVDAGQVSDLAERGC